MADLASIAAATTAGYREIVIQKSANLFVVILEKFVGGAPGEAGFTIRAYGEGTTQAAAETAALASLNQQRTDRYGGGARPAHSSANGGSHTLDVG